ncbi:hypothetical protein INT45_009761 [Circinella minor]|uniref:Galactose oxidase n=1 Tax=Circinella minor TaxID=1195481 RepID=A0A8H7RX38_9FUNG|nr:hypothetical protein INT45_009761 [Circinella minor]
MILCSFAILLALILSASCAAAERVQHAAVLAPNGTIYIIGGMSINIDTEQKQTTTTTTITRQKIDVNHDLIISHYQSSSQQSILTLQGHTAHWNPLNNEPMTLFGTPTKTTKQNKHENDDRTLSTLPIPRYHHASSIKNDKNDIYVVGGRDFQGRLLKDIWKLSLDSMKWVQLYQLGHHHRGFAGHSTVLYRNWLIACLGVTKNNNEGGGCTLCFDTNSLVEHSCNNYGHPELPLGRTEAGLTQIQEHDSIVIVHGGLSNDNKKNLGDLWKLDLTQTPNLVWSQIKSNLAPRAGHSLVPLNDTTLLLYGGRLDENDTPAPIDYLDISTTTRTTKQSSLHKRAPPREDNSKDQPLPGLASSKPQPTTITETSSKEQKSQPVTTTKQQATETETETGSSTNDGQQQQSSEKGKGGLTSGAVAGIIIGVLALVGIIIGIFIWKRKQQRRRMRYFHNRASRFSLSTPPPSRPASIRMGGKTASLPEMSHFSAAVDPSRLSTLSFGSDFQLPAHHENQQSSQRASYSSVSMPQSRFDTRTNSFIQQNHPQDRDMIQYPEPIAMTAAQRRRQQHRDSSQSFKRLTLNIPSALRTTTLGGSGIGGETPTSTKDDTTPSPSILKRYTVAGLADRRRSSMFGFRASRLLHIPGNANTNNSSTTTTTSSITDEPISRMSMDARSVSSVQWVGFNDSMDYREQQWNPTVQLAVTNEQKRRSVSSSRPTSCAAESLGSSASPRSAMFRFSNTSVHQPYRLSTQELHSWDDHINQRVLRTRNSNRNSSSNGQSSGSSSSLPTTSRAIERFNNYRVSTSSDESSIVITSGTAAATTSR